MRMAEYALEISEPSGSSALLNFTSELADGCVQGSPVYLGSVKNGPDIAYGATVKFITMGSKGRPVVVMNEVKFPNFYTFISEWHKLVNVGWITVYSTLGLAGNLMNKRVRTRSGTGNVIGIHREDNGFYTALVEYDYSYAVSHDIGDLFLDEPPYDFNTPEPPHPTFVSLKPSKALMDALEKYVKGEKIPEPLPKVAPPVNSDESWIIIGVNEFGVSTWATASGKNKEEAIENARSMKLFRDKMIVLALRPALRIAKEILWHGYRLDPQRQIADLQEMADSLAKRPG